MTTSNGNKTFDAPSRGWNWTALFLGPFWYLFNGLTKKGFLLIVIGLLSFGLAAPFIWIYCAMKANSDLYERELYNKSRFDINKI